MLVSRERGSSHRRQVQSTERPRAMDPERHLLTLLLTYPLAYAARQGTIYQIRSNDILDSRRRHIADEILTHEGDVEAALNDLSEDLRDYADAIRGAAIIRDDLTPAMADRELRQAIMRLESVRYQERLTHIQQTIDEARASGDRELLRESLARMSELAASKPKFAPDESPYFKDLRTPRRESSAS